MVAVCNCDSIFSEFVIHKPDRRSKAKPVIHFQQHFLIQRISNAVCMV